MKDKGLVIILQDILLRLLLVVVAEDIKVVNKGVLEKDIRGSIHLNDLNKV